VTVSKVTVRSFRSDGFRSGYSRNGDFRSDGFGSDGFRIDGRERTGFFCSIPPFYFFHVAMFHDEKGGALNALKNDVLPLFEPPFFQRLVRDLKLLVIEVGQRLHGAKDPQDGVFLEVIQRRGHVREKSCGQLQNCQFQKWCFQK
jgi:hypothetical protein